MNDYKGNGISGRDHYIFCSSVMLGTVRTSKFWQKLICINRMGKTNLTNQRWCHTTCLQHPCYDVGCYPWLKEEHVYEPNSQPYKSENWKTIFFISHLKHMLWVIKRTVSIEHTKHTFKLMGKKIFTILRS